MLQRLGSARGEPDEWIIDPPGVAVRKDLTVRRVADDVGLPHQRAKEVGMKPVGEDHSAPGEEATTTERAILGKLVPEPGLVPPCHSATRRAGTDLGRRFANPLLEATRRGRHPANLRAGPRPVLDNEIAVSRSPRLASLGIGSP